MVQNPPEGTQRIAPYLLYNNAATAIEFLTKAFGFVERFRIPGPNGGIGHAELGHHDSVVMLADAVAEMGHKSPADLAGSAHGLCVYVDDVDAHYAHAKEAGAEILTEPENQFYGDRTYRARDPEGHQWNFHQHVEDIDFENMDIPGQ